MLICLLEKEMSFLYSFSKKKTDKKIKRDRKRQLIKNKTIL